MRRTVAVFIALMLLALLLSGCRIGVGIGVEVRLGYVTFQSVDERISGPFFLDGKRMGDLPPLGAIRCLVTLDFPHEVRVVSASCPGGVCVFVFPPPFQPGEVIPLSLTGRP
ncbi:hypothetical protein [Candidatus Caldatribacterium saccharofermentans]|uniref:PEGA domain-containing protein n=1 Tax=Candidatus Caldatribacterium saccharofermentans TaxID=1454753 RepID=A0A7V4TGG6_9BACT